MSTNPTPSETRRCQHKTALLIFAAVIIFLFGVHLKINKHSEEEHGPTIDFLINSIATGSDNSNDPRKAVYLFEPVDINVADGVILSSLKGIGPQIAKRIVDFRHVNGCFSGPEELLRVKGIGSKKLARIRDNVTTGPCTD